jgi:hypothetical protein
VLLVANSPAAGTNSSAAAVTVGGSRYTDWRKQTGLLPQLLLYVAAATPVDQ